MTKRIAMWSGPRNLSTAMMYAFAARGDAQVWDEPFYAAYLDKTGLEHPMRAEVITGGERDAGKVAKALLAPSDQPIFYQKHMCQHMIEGVPRDWMAEVTNAFLIRHPARVVASFAAKHDALTLSDIGFTQQTELFERVADQLGQAPVVIDSADIRNAPEPALTKLCAALDIPFTNRMLSWDAGPKPFDGVWASHWYNAVHRSTDLHSPEGEYPPLSSEQARLVDAALPHYERLAAFRITL